MMSLAIKAWVPKEAVSCLKELKRDPDITIEDIQFLAPLFEDENMETFFDLLKEQDRFFFYDLFYTLLSSLKYLAKSQLKYEERDTLKTEVNSLQKQIEKMQGTLSRICKAKHHDVYLFDKFFNLLEELEGYRASLNKKLSNVKKNKNALRPVNRKNLRVNTDKDKLSDMKADYCARYLIVFFDNQTEIKLKPIQRKNLIGGMVGVLTGIELTPKDLDDLKRDG